MAPLSFAQDIRPLFRDYDIEEMNYHGLDLTKYEVVSARSAEIYERLVDQTMPSDDAWPAETLAKFKQWMDEGLAP
jgi:hypothetical protein